MSDTIENKTLLPTPRIDAAAITVPSLGTWENTNYGKVEIVNADIAREVEQDLHIARAEARTAIKISTAYAKLRQAQGEPVNEDFITCLKSIKIVPAKTSQQKHHEN